MVLSDDAMLTSVWLPSPDVESGEDQSLPEPMQFLTTEFDLPTPPTFDTEAWDEQLALPSMDALTNAINSTNESHRPRYYCVKCAKAFSRPDSLRRHAKLYCKKVEKGMKEEKETKEK